jgi:hypothetical protein
MGVPTKSRLLKRQGHEGASGPSGSASEHQLQGTYDQSVTNVELTLDAIAEVFKGEDDFRTYFRHDNTPAGKANVYTTSKFLDQMHWGDRVRWRELPGITVLQPGEVIPRMRDMRIMVEQGYRNQLIMGAHNKMMQRTSDDMIIWLATVMSKAWSDDNDSFTPEVNEEALQRLMYCRRQQILRIAASQGGTLHIDNDC